MLCMAWLSVANVARIHVTICRELLILKLNLQPAVMYIIIGVAKKIWEDEKRFNF